MTNVQSKLLTTVECGCKAFHPWTDRCVNSIAGIMLSSIPYCLRVYSIVYALSLVMRHRIPTLEDLKRTVLGILQSSSFLVTNAYTFMLYNCLLRNLMGFYHCTTVAFVPAFLASWTAILVERPARRPLLALYVANVATESLWNLAESRGLVRSIPQGQTLIFGVSVSILLYLYRLGLHKTSAKDSLFDILRIFVGKPEEGTASTSEHKSNSEENVDTTPPAASASRASSRRPLNFTTISGLVQVYARFIESLKSKHESCPHKDPCLRYAIWGGLKPFIGGVSLQIALKLILNIKKIAQMKMNWRKNVFHSDTLKLGVFLGSFSFLYKSVSCILRHSFGCDDPRFAIPAGLIGSVAFTQYPDVTVALYVMWKMLQIVYNLGIEKRVLPKVPGFTIFLYSLCTSILFHAGILEPKSLRPSYFKFLETISGERVSRFNLKGFDGFGLNSAENAKEVIRKLNIDSKSTLPRFALSDW